MRLLFTIFLGVVGFALFWFFQQYSQHYFQTRTQLSSWTKEMLHDETRLEYEVLKNSFFLYQNYDELSSIQKRLQTSIQQAKTFPILNQNEELRTIYERYEKLLVHKLEQIEKFKQTNATIKNSITYLLRMLQNMPPKYLKQKKIATAILRLEGDILLAKNALDPDFLHPIQKEADLLNSFIKHKNPKEYLFRLLIHTKLFVHAFPSYTTTLHTITHLQTIQTLKSLENSLERYFAQQGKKVQELFYLLLFFYFLSILGILYLIHRLSQENSALKELQSKLQHYAITDDLTGLLNRRAYKQDIRRIASPFFAIVDINRFKQYNDFYGNKVGDHILRQSAKILQKALPLHYEAKLYRLGSDEFGVLIDEKTPIDEKRFASSIIETFNKEKITFKNIEFFVSVSVGMTRKRPLLESADMALRSIKERYHRNYAIFSKELDYFEQIKENIKKSKTIKEAVQKDYIVPFFQPIIHNATGAIAKYESLGRIREKDRYESIYPYLDLAKEMGLYPKITKAMLYKSFLALKKLQKPISLNISMNDIENPDILKLLGELLKQNANMAPFITFEILESETLKDYKTVKDFISIIKAQGCQVAIDDFGSGYSNFAHIFNMEIDYIKIDGSLIEQLPTSQNARRVVRAIHDLAKESGIQTIAEFVSNAAIFEEVKNIGIDYSQGYFFEKPRPII